MQMSYDILFASSNKNKFEEAKNIVSKFGLKLKFLKLHLQEIQANTLEEIATTQSHSGIFNLFKTCNCRRCWSFHKIIEWISRTIFVICV